MQRARLESLLAGMRGLRIAVVGDLFLDAWIFIDRGRDEPSLETGKIAYQVDHAVYTPGAAGTVLGNLAALGVGTLRAVSLLGEDGHGLELLRGLHRLGVDTGDVLQDAALVTPTYCKPLFMPGADVPGAAAVEHNRMDYKNLRPTPPALEDALIARIHALPGTVDAVLVLDQLTEANTGVVTDRVRDALAAMARAHPELLVFADSRAHLHKFRDMTLKCNHLEAAAITGTRAPAEGDFSREAAFAALDALAERAGRAPFVTCGAQGIACVCADGSKALVRAARQTGPIDVCGAGDSCSAGIVSALCAGADRQEATFVANLVAGVTVRKLGTTGSASPQEILTLYEEQFAE